MKLLRKTITPIIFALCFFSCSQKSANEAISNAEAVLEQHPDSALNILNTIKVETLWLKITFRSGLNLLVKKNTIFAKNFEPIKI